MSYETKIRIFSGIALIVLIAVATWARRKYGSRILEWWERF